MAGPSMLSSAEIGVCPTGFWCSMSELENPQLEYKHGLVHIHPPLPLVLPEPVICQQLQYTCSGPSQTVGVKCVSQTDTQAYKLGQSRSSDVAEYGDVVLGSFVRIPTSLDLSPIAILYNDGTIAGLRNMDVPKANGLFNTTIELPQVKRLCEKSVSFEDRHPKKNTVSGVIEFGQYEIAEFYTENGRELVSGGRSKMLVATPLKITSPYIRFLKKQSRYDTLDSVDEHQGCWYRLTDLFMSQPGRIRTAHFIDLDPRPNNIQGIIGVGGDILLNQRPAPDEIILEIKNRIHVLTNCIPRAAASSASLLFSESFDVYCSFSLFTQGAVKGQLYVSHHADIAVDVVLEDYRQSETPSSRVLNTIDTDPREDILRFTVASGPKEPIVFKATSASDILSVIQQAMNHPLETNVDSKGQEPLIYAIPFTQQGRLSSNWKLVNITDWSQNHNDACQEYGAFMLGSVLYEPSALYGPIYTSEECRGLCYRDCVAWQWYNNTCDLLSSVHHTVPQTPVLQGASDCHRLTFGSYLSDLPNDSGAINFQLKSLVFEKRSTFGNQITAIFSTTSPVSEVLNLQAALICHNEPIQSWPTFPYDASPLPFIQSGRLDLILRTRYPSIDGCKLQISDARLHWSQEFVLNIGTYSISEWTINQRLELPAQEFGNLGPVALVTPMPNYGAVELTTSEEYRGMATKRLAVYNFTSVSSPNCEVAELSNYLVEVRSASYGRQTCTVNLDLEVAGKFYRKTQEIELCGSMCLPPVRDIVGSQAIAVDEDDSGGIFRGHIELITMEPLRDTDCYVLEAMSPSGPWKLVGFELVTSGIRSYGYSSTISILEHVIDNGVITSDLAVQRLVCYSSDTNPIVHDLTNFDWNLKDRPEAQDCPYEIIGDLNDDPDYLSFHLKVDKSVYRAICLADPDRPASCKMNLERMPECSTISSTLGTTYRCAGIRAVDPVRITMLQMSGAYCTISNIEANTVFTYLNDPLYRQVLSLSPLADATTWDFSSRLGTIQMCDSWNSETLLTGKGCRLSDPSRLIPPDFYHITQPCIKSNGQVPGVDILEKVFAKSLIECQALCENQSQSCTHYTFEVHDCRDEQEENCFSKSTSESNALVTKICILRGNQANSRANEGPKSLLSQISYPASTHKHSVTCVRAKSEVTNNILISMRDIDTRENHMYGELAILELVPVDHIKRYEVFAKSVDDLLIHAGTVSKTPPRLDDPPYLYSTAIRLSDFAFDRLIILGIGDTRTTIYGLAVVDEISDIDSLPGDLELLRQIQQRKQDDNKLAAKWIHQSQGPVTIRIESSEIDLHTPLRQLLVWQNEWIERLTFADLFDADEHSENEELLFGFQKDDKTPQLEQIDGLMLISWPEVQTKGSWDLYGTLGRNKWLVARGFRGTVKVLTTYLDLRFATFELCGKHSCVPLPAVTNKEHPQIVYSDTQHMTSVNDCPYQIVSDEDLDATRNVIKVLVKNSDEELHVVNVRDIIDKCPQAGAVQDFWPYAVLGKDCIELQNDDSRPRYIHGSLSVTMDQLSVQKPVYAICKWKSSSNLLTNPILLNQSDVLSDIWLGNVPFGTRNVLNDEIICDLYSGGSTLLGDVPVVIQGQNTLERDPASPREILVDTTETTVQFKINRRTLDRFEVSCDTAPIWMVVADSLESKRDPQILCHSLGTTKWLNISSNECRYVYSKETRYRLCNNQGPLEEPFIEKLKASNSPTLTLIRYHLDDVQIHEPIVLTDQEGHFTFLPSGTDCPLNNAIKKKCPLIRPDGQAYYIIDESLASVSIPYVNGGAVTYQVRNSNLSGASYCDFEDGDDRPFWINTQLQNCADKAIESIVVRLITGGSISYAPVLAGPVYYLQEEPLFINQLAWLEIKFEGETEPQILEMIDSAPMEITSPMWYQEMDLMTLADCQVEYAVIDKQFHKITTSQPNHDIGLCYLAISDVYTDSTSDVELQRRSPGFMRQSIYMAKEIPRISNIAYVNDQWCNDQVEFWSSHNGNLIVTGPSDGGGLWVWPGDMDLALPNHFVGGKTSSGHIKLIGSAAYFIVYKNQAHLCPAYPIIQSLFRTADVETQSNLTGFYIARHLVSDNCEILRQTLLNLVTMELGLAYFSLDLPMAAIVNEYTKPDFWQNVLEPKLQQQCHYSPKKQSRNLLLWLHNRQTTLQEQRVSCDEIDNSLKRRANLASRLYAENSEDWYSLFNVCDESLASFDAQPNSESLVWLCAKHNNRLGHFAGLTRNIRLKNLSVDCNPELFLPTSAVLLSSPSRNPLSTSLSVDWSLRELYDPEGRGYILRHEVPDVLWQLTSAPNSVSSAVPLNVAEPKLTQIVRDEGLDQVEFAISHFWLEKLGHYSAIQVRDNLLVFNEDSVDCHDLVQVPGWISKLNCETSDSASTYMGVMDGIQSLVTHQGLNIKTTIAESYSMSYADCATPFISLFEPLDLDEGLVCVNQSQSAYCCNYITGATPSILPPAPPFHNPFTIEQPQKGVVAAATIVRNMGVVLIHSLSSKGLKITVHQNTRDGITSLEDWLSVEFTDRFGQPFTGSSSPVRSSGAKAFGTVTYEYTAARKYSSFKVLDKASGDWLEGLSGLHIPQLLEGAQQAVALRGGICGYQACLDNSSCGLCEYTINDALSSLFLNDQELQRKDRILCGSSQEIQLAPDALRAMLDDQNALRCALTANSLANQALKRVLGLVDNEFTDYTHAARFAEVTSLDIRDHFPKLKTFEDAIGLYRITRRVSDLTSGDDWRLQNNVLIYPSRLLPPLDLKHLKAWDILPQLIFDPISPSALTFADGASFPVLHQEREADDKIPRHIKLLHNHVFGNALPFDVRHVKTLCADRLGRLSFEGFAGRDCLQVRYYDLYEALSRLTPLKYPPRERRVYASSAILLILLLWYIQHRRCKADKSSEVSQMIHPVKWSPGCRIADVLGSCTLNVFERLGSLVTSQVSSIERVRNAEAECWMFDDPEEEEYFETLCYEEGDSYDASLPANPIAFIEKKGALQLAADLQASWLITREEFLMHDSCSLDDADALKIHRLGQSIRRKSSSSLNTLIKMAGCKDAQASTDELATPQTSDLIPLAHLKAGVKFENGAIDTYVLWLGPNQEELLLIPEFTLIKLADPLCQNGISPFNMSNIQDLIVVPLLDISSIQIQSFIVDDRPMSSHCLNLIYGDSSCAVYADLEQLVGLEQWIRSSIEQLIKSIADALLLGPSLQTLIDPGLKSRLIVTSDRITTWSAIPYTACPCVVDESAHTNIYVHNGKINLQVYPFDNRFLAEPEEECCDTRDVTPLNRTFQRSLTNDTPVDRQAQRSLEMPLGDAFGLRSQPRFDESHESPADAKLSTLHQTFGPEPNNDSWADQVDALFPTIFPLWHFQPLPTSALPSGWSSGTTPLVPWIQLDLKQVVSVDMIQGGPMDTMDETSTFGVNLKIENGDTLLLGFGNSSVAKQVYLALIESMEDLARGESKDGTTKARIEHHGPNRHDVVLDLGLNATFVRKLASVVALLRWRDSSAILKDQFDSGACATPTLILTVLSSALLLHWMTAFNVSEWLILVLAYLGASACAVALNWTPRGPICHSLCSDCRINERLVNKPIYQQNAVRVMKIALGVMLSALAYLKLPLSAISWPFIASVYLTSTFVWPFVKFMHICLVLRGLTKVGAQWALEGWSQMCLTRLKTPLIPSRLITDFQDTMLTNGNSLSLNGSGQKMTMKWGSCRSEPPPEMKTRSFLEIESCANSCIV